MMTFKTTVVMLATVMALSSVSGSCFAEDSQAVKNAANGKFDQGKQGDAKGGLERTAGQQTTDVNVPAVPAPTPVSTSTGTAGGYGVTPSTGSAGGYSVSPSTGTATGK